MIVKINTKEGKRDKLWRKDRNFFRKDDSRINKRGGKKGWW